MQTTTPLLTLRLFMWIFGYGSLVWRPDFEWDQRHPGYVEGWMRRFWQHSPDHRGVPDAPGRVVTMLPDSDARCWGVAYRVRDDHAADVRRQLDVREQGGYERHRVAVQTRQNAPDIGGALMYIATPENPNWAGPAALADIANQVVRSEGPSGHNVEYVLELARALRELGADDPHVFDLAEHVRARLDNPE